MLILYFLIIITSVITITNQSTLLKVIGTVEKKADERKVNELKMATNACCTECTKPYVSFPVGSVHIIYSCHNDYMIDPNRIVFFHLTKINFTRDVCDGCLENVEFNEKTLQLIVNCCLSINNKCSSFESDNHSNEATTYMTKLFVLNYNFKFHLEEAARSVEKATRFMRSIWFTFGVIMVILILLLTVAILIKCWRYFK